MTCVQALSVVQSDVDGLSKCCQHTSGALAANKASITELLGAMEQVQRDLEVSERRSQLVHTFLDEFQLSAAELAALRVCPILMHATEESEICCSRPCTCPGLCPQYEPQGSNVLLLSSGGAGPCICTHSSKCMSRNADGPCCLAGVTGMLGNVIAQAAQHQPLLMKMLCSTACISTLPCSWPAHLTTPQPPLFAPLRPSAQEETLGQAFFDVLARVGTIHANCRRLLRTHHQRAGLELMDAMSAHQESAYERLCRSAILSALHVSAGP